MINIPKPPTDNLYKFMAIGGFILFLSSWIVPGIVYLKIIEINSDLLILETATNIEASKLESTGDKSSSISPEKYLKLKTELFDIQRRIEEGKLYLLMGFIFGILLGSGGMIASYYGFHFWYHRLQVYEDKILRAKFETSSKTFNNN